ncbi:lysine-rich arabinogalactan protein 18-like [Cryptomeria japonica]|uniref:lysine-rich arabinogalactan protein 18-like n=1 Tax=Cryptomeria japonica TaxID=3369 RepID=UPI0027D9E0D5|nr:lysine-rich arabinogalactan protein 18-like [Cryptomeria japonica]
MASSPSTPTSSTSKAQAVGTSSSAPKIIDVVPLIIVHPLLVIANVPVVNPTPSNVASTISELEPSAPPKENPPKPKKKRVAKTIVVSTDDKSSDDPTPPPKSKKPASKRRKLVAKPSAQASSVEASFAQNPPTEEQSPQAKDFEPKKRKTPTKGATPRAPKKKNRPLRKGNKFSLNLSKLRKLQFHWLQ